MPTPRIEAFLAYVEYASEHLSEEFDDIEIHGVSV